jgi:hypothetical protein
MCKFYCFIVIIIIIIIFSLYNYNFNKELFENTNKQNYCTLNSCPPIKQSNKYIYCQGLSKNKTKRCPPPNSTQCIC